MTALSGAAVPLDEVVGGVAAPLVSVGEVAGVERWLAIAGPDLGVEGVFGLNAVKNYERPLAAWPDAVKKLRHDGGQVWHATTSEGTLTLLPRERKKPWMLILVQVLFREQAAAVADNRHWLHEAVYWLWHDAHTDLNLTFPAAARVVAVSLDGVETPPLQPDPAHLWLPLPGRQGLQCVRVLWSYEPAEPLDRPNFDAIKLDGAQ